MSNDDKEEGEVVLNPEPSAITAERGVGRGGGFRGGRGAWRGGRGGSIPTAPGPRSPPRVGHGRFSPSGPDSNGGHPPRRRSVSPGAMPRDDPDGGGGGRPYPPRGRGLMRGGPMRSPARPLPHPPHGGNFGGDRGRSPPKSNQPPIRSPPPPAGSAVLGRPSMRSPPGPGTRGGFRGGRGISHPRGRMGSPPGTGIGRGNPPPTFEQSGRQHGTSGPINSSASRPEDDLRDSLPPSSLPSRFSGRPAVDRSKDSFSRSEDIQIEEGEVASERQRPRDVDRPRNLDRPPPGREGPDRDDLSRQAIRYEGGVRIGGPRGPPPHMRHELEAAPRRPFIEEPGLERGRPNFERPHLPRNSAEDFVRGGAETRPLREYQGDRGRFREGPSVPSRAQDPGFDRLRGEDGFERPSMPVEDPDDRLPRRKPPGPPGPGIGIPPEFMRSRSPRPSGQASRSIPVPPRTRSIDRFGPGPFVRPGPPGRTRGEPGREENFGGSGGPPGGDRVRFDDRPGGPRRDRSSNPTAMPGRSDDRFPDRSAPLNRPFEIDRDARRPIEGDLRGPRPSEGDSDIRRPMEGDRGMRKPMEGDRDAPGIRPGTGDRGDARLFRPNEIDRDTRGPRQVENDRDSRVSRPVEGNRDWRGPRAMEAGDRDFRGPSQIPSRPLESERDARGPRLVEGDRDVRGPRPPEVEWDSRGSRPIDNERAMRGPLFAQGEYDPRGSRPIDGPRDSRGPRSVEDRDARISRSLGGQRPIESDRIGEMRELRHLDSDREIRGPRQPMEDYRFEPRGYRPFRPEIDIHDPRDDNREQHAPPPHFRDQFHQRRDDLDAREEEFRPKRPRLDDSALMRDHPLRRRSPGRPPFPVNQPDRAFRPRSPPLTGGPPSGVSGSHGRFHGGGSGRFEGHAGMAANAPPKVNQTGSPEVARRRSSSPTLESADRRPIRQPSRTGSMPREEEKDRRTPSQGRIERLKSPEPVEPSPLGSSEVERALEGFNDLTTVNARLLTGLPFEEQVTAEKLRQELENLRTAHFVSRLQNVTSEMQRSWAKYEMRQADEQLATIQRARNRLTGLI